MKRDRSKGVTFWGWTFIIIGIFGLLLTILLFNKFINYQGEIPKKQISYFWDFLAFSLSIVGGIYLLKLKNWARWMILILCFLGIVDTILTSPIVFNNSAVEQKQEELIKKYKPEHQQKVRKQMECMDKTLPFVNYFTIFIFIILYLCPIIFFTRPKVKEQFKNKIDKIQ
ncbi:MAG: hypothetical protein K9M00_02380 [Candidatus Omnitrophica bacterium]|nr:hypothetical protein [Candidatus Omnitrophota bacterium]